MIVIDTKENEKIYGRAYRELYVIILNLTKEMKEKIIKKFNKNPSEIRKFVNLFRNQSQ